MLNFKGCINWACPPSNSGIFCSLPMDTTVDRALYTVSSSVLCTVFSDATNERVQRNARMQAGHTS